MEPYIATHSAPGPLKFIAKASIHSFDSTVPERRFLAAIRSGQCRPERNKTLTAPANAAAHCRRSEPLLCRQCSGSSQLTGAPRRSAHIAVELSLADPLTAPMQRVLG